MTDESDIRAQRGRTRVDSAGGNDPVPRPPQLRLVGHQAHDAVHRQETRGDSGPQRFAERGAKGGLFLIAGGLRRCNLCSSEVLGPSFAVGGDICLVCRWTATEAFRAHQYRLARIRDARSNPYAHRRAFETRVKGLR
jgi:hypothetical protein